MANPGKGKANGKAPDKGEELEMEEDSGGGKKKLLLIGGVVALLAIGGGAAWFFMGSDEPPPAEASLSDDMAQPKPQQAEAAAKGVDAGTALYVAMPRPFVFNVPGSVRERLVQIKVQLLVRGDSAEEEAKRHIPLIEGTLLKTFSSTNADDLATSAGKEALKSKSLQDVQSTMVEVTGKKIVERVLFTGFVMQ